MKTFPMDEMYIFVDLEGIQGCLFVEIVCFLTVFYI